MELVEREHDRLDGDLEGLLGASVADRKPLARRALQRLSAYLLAEEQCLYPALFVTMGSETPLAPLIDHDKLKSLVAELLRMEPMEASFAACVSNLQGRLRSYHTAPASRPLPVGARRFQPRGAAPDRRRDAAVPVFQPARRTGKPRQRQGLA